MHRHVLVARLSATFRVSGASRGFRRRRIPPPFPATNAGIKLCLYVATLGGRDRGHTARKRAAASNRWRTLVSRVKKDFVVILFACVARRISRRKVRQWSAQVAKRTCPATASSAPNVVRAYHACAAHVGILTKLVQISVLTVVPR
jgi:hypothetical protein